MDIDTLYRSAYIAAFLGALYDHADLQSWLVSMDEATKKAVREQTEEQASEAMTSLLAEFGYVTA
jgi:hypothetical protein